MSFPHRTLLTAALALAAGCSVRSQHEFDWGRHPERADSARADSARADSARRAPSPPPALRLTRP